MAGNSGTEDTAPSPHALSKTGSTHQAGTSLNSTQSPSHHGSSSQQGFFPMLDSDLLRVNVRTAGESSPESPVLASKRFPDNGSIRGGAATPTGGEKEGGRSRPRSAGGVSSSIMAEGSTQ